MCVPVSADYELDYPIIFLDYVSPFTAVNGKNLLTQLKVPQEKIAYFYQNNNDTTQAVQAGLLWWASHTEPPPTWRDLLDKMKPAGFAMKRCEALKKRILSLQSQGDSVYYELPYVLDRLRYTPVTTHTYVCMCVYMIPLDGHYSHQLFVCSMSVH